MGGICGFLPSIASQTCCGFWSTPSCWYNLCTADCSTGSSKSTWYAPHNFISIPCLVSNGQLSGFTGKDPSGTNFKFFSSFQSNLLVDGLRNQIGWGHIWNRFAGPLSCRHQSHQCALTPLLPPAWWDGEWQSPIPRDIQRLKSYGVTLTENGDVVESHLQAFCRSREDRVKTLKIISQWKNSDACGDQTVVSMLADLPRAPSIIHRGLCSWCVNACCMHQGPFYRGCYSVQLIRNVIGNLPLPFQLIACFLRTNFVHITLDIWFICCSGLIMI